LSPGYAKLGCRGRAAADLETAEFSRASEAEDALRVARYALHFRSEFFQQLDPVIRRYG
jgi:hypothetical protein